MALTIYLAGPAGTEQELDHQQLELRGYTVRSYYQILKSYNHEVSTGELRRLHVNAMLCADVVVVNDRIPTPHLLEIGRIGRYAHLRVVDQSDLPAQCPHPFRFEEVMDSLSLATPLPEAAERRTEPSLLERAERWLNSRVAWFLTNGNKQPPPVTYPLPEASRNITA